MKILFIDDDPSVNRYHQIILEEYVNTNLEIIFHEDGEPALQYLLQFKEEKEKYPTFIFLDLNMPLMDGWEFLEQYKKHCLPLAKIVILTTSENPNHRRKAQANPLVFDFIAKPLEVEYVDQLVAKII